MSEQRASSWARRANGPDLAFVLEAFVLVAASSVAVRWLPFLQIGRLASLPLGSPHRQATSMLTRRVGWAVVAAAKRSPWRAVCFERGIAAQIMLRRRGVDSTLYFGAAPDRDRGLVAHVWVRAGDKDVVGCEDAEKFPVLATFPPRL